MALDSVFNIHIGFDSREEVAAQVCAHSIRKRTSENLNIKFLKHRELRKAGHFKRPWLIDGDRGDYMDLLDSRPFSTEFSHTRFLIPHLQQHKGWALFMDSDMIFLSDIKSLIKLCDPKYAVLCVKHKHVPTGDALKMDGRLQLRYNRKNWSSFMLFNCEHFANKRLTKEYVNFTNGGEMHAMAWLDDMFIGSLPSTYNYISGVSPTLPSATKIPVLPSVIHFSEGGPWFEQCRNVPYADLWTKEFEDWQRNAEHGYSPIPTTKYDLVDRK